MAEFVASDPGNAGVDPLLYGRTQQNSLASIGMQQDQANQAAFRANASGLAARDPAATGLALGANPTATTNFLATTPTLDANTRAQGASDIAATGALAGAALYADPSQRQAVYEAGRQQLLAAGHRNIPAYTGDGGLITSRATALTAQEQLAQQNQVMTFGAPQSPLQSIPGGVAGQQGPAGGAPGVAADPGPVPTGPVPSMITSEAQRQGVDPTLALTAAKIESGLGTVPDRPGSQYQGVFQLGSEERAANGADSGYGTNQGQQVRAGIGQLAKVQQAATAALGRPPAPWETYLAHQQGVGGLTAYQADPTRPAIDAMLSTPEGQQKGRAWAAQAVLGNIPQDQRAALGNNPTSAQFLNMWQQKYARIQQSVAGMVPRQAPGQAPAGQPPVPPVQTASTTGTTGLPATANDASGAPAPEPAAPTAPQQGLDDTLARFRAQVPQSLADPQHSIGPGQTIGPSPAAPAAPALVPPQTAFPGQNRLAGLGAPQQAAPATPGPNALAGLGAGPPQQPNALAGIGQPQPGSPGAPALPQGAAPANPQAQPQSTVGNPLYLQPGERPGIVGGRYAPVPGLDGYVYVQRNGIATPVRLPTAPGKGVDTKVTPDGSVVSTDLQDGHIVNVQRGILPNSGRLTAVDDGQGGKTLVAPNGQTVAQSPSNTGQILKLEDYRRDQTLAQQAADELVSARQADFNIREQRGITNGLTSTGAFGERKAQLSRYLEGVFDPATAKAFERAAGLDDASQLEQFAKTALSASGAQENANVGARGGFQLTKLYTQANPGLGSQPNTIRDIQNLQAVSNLSQQDYLQGLVGYINQNSDSARAGGPYNPSTKFSHDWNASTNPQVYVAAAELLNQKPYARWSRGLSQEDQVRAQSIAARADNTAQYDGPSGRAALTPYGAPTQQQGAAAQPQQPAQQPQAAGGVPSWAAAALRQNPGQAAAFDAKFGAGASRGVLAQ